MFKLKQKDKKNRIRVNYFEKKRFILKSILKNTSLPNTVRWNAVLLLTNLPQNSSQIRLVNRCIITGRKGKICKLYKFSRLILLRFIRSGYVAGIKKSTW